MEHTWKAIYSDGSSLKQYNGKNVSKYTDIDRNLLRFFEIYDGEKLILRLHLDNGKRLIYRRRVEQNVTTNIRTVVSLVGWQLTINGKNIQSINYIFEDGHIESAGEWTDKNIFYAPNLIKEEKEN